MPGRQSHDKDGDDIKKGEQHQSSQTFGLLVDYNIDGHWGLQSGLAVTNRTIAINPKEFMLPIMEMAALSTCIIVHPVIRFFHRSLLPALLLATACKRRKQKIPFSIYRYPYW